MSTFTQIKINSRKAANEIQKNIISEFMEFGKYEKVSAEEFNKRISICESCEDFNPENRRCKICTCFMDIKASLKEMPIVGGEVKCANTENPKW